MSDLFTDLVAEDALAAIRDAEPEEAARRLREILAAHPERVDLWHALAVVELRRGEARDAYALTFEAEKVARERADETAGQLMGPIHLVRGAAAEELDDPAAAEAAYRAVLVHEPDNPRVRQALGYLLLGWGRLDEGLAELRGYLDDRTDQPEYLDATEKLVEAARRFVADDVHPREFLEAHRGAYVEFFDHHAKRMSEQGWMMEPARMVRADDGRVVPVIPEGARPYAAVRVDMVDPKTGQVGRVGDQPMIVALAGYEPLARAQVLVDWPEDDVPFPVWVSSQCPWNHLPVQVRFEPGVERPVEVLDPVVGDWYTAGFEGAFGTPEGERFHEITDLEDRGDGRVAFWVDCGRARTDAVRDLFNRLHLLHDRAPIAAVLLGRGFVPR